MCSAIWKQISVARDETHHILDDRPLYPQRFDRVLKYHECGLAPVQKDSEAWHIDIKGKEAYPRRFLRVFGFYEDRATVVSPDGWHHIMPDGSDAYAKRYAWCGNYQESHCTVRLDDGCYSHILPHGEKVYSQQWRYAGDYSDGIAVVQADDGRSSHIDSSGAFIHGNWFYDLDVYHKGFARARDADGWMHVGLDGRAQYEGRFASVEPFYNGQARIERFDGALEVIDEQGTTLIELCPSIRSEFASLSVDLVGFWRTQTIGTAVELGVFEALPASTEAIAAGCNLNPHMTRRLLRALGELGLVGAENHIWQTTSRGTYLLAEHPMTLADAAVEYARHFTGMWAELPGALRDGGDWTFPAIFDQVATDSSRVMKHHRMLRSYARHDYGAVADLLKLSGTECVIDAGGGLGVFADLLLRRYPKLKIILIDRPEVTALLAPSEFASERIHVRAADIFQPWGVMGDVVILSRVLHDWNDENAQKILDHARNSLTPGGRVFIVEMLLSESSYSGGLCDLHLLMASGGQERTLEAYDALLQRCGFEMTGVYRSAALPVVIEGTCHEK